MKRALFVLTALLAAAPAARAQGIDVRLENPAVRILQNYTLKSGETVDQVVVVGGDATLEGHVDHDVVVVLGKVQVASTATIDGSLVTIAGTATVADGARVGGDLVAIGNLQAPASFSPGGQQIAIGTLGLDERLRRTIPWLTRGLLFGRLIVPDLSWVWATAGLFFLINLLFNLVLDAPVGACATTLRATPLSAFLVGLLVLVLAGPVCFLLALSVIGIAVIPFLLCALLIAAIIGRVGFARWIGMSVLHESDPSSRAQTLRSFLLGSALMCAAYMAPVLGIVVWALGGVFGLGAAAIAFFSAYRRENPKRRKPAPAVAPPQAQAPPAAPVVPPAPSALAVPVELASPAGFAPADLPPAPEHPYVPEPPRADAPPSTAFPPEGGSSGRSLLGFPHATFYERLAAFALDFVLIAILAQVVRFDRLFGDWSPDGNLLLVALVYHIGFWTWKQTTVGGIICQLRITRTDGTPMRFAEAIVRGLSGIFSLVLVGIGFLWILRDPERQAWHDRIAGTFVVNVPRNWPV
jgi:uncharacterized RDD family membrane protein YckC